MFRSGWSPVQADYLKVSYYKKPKPRSFGRNKNEDKSEESDVDFADLAPV